MLLCDMFYDAIAADCYHIRTVDFKRLRVDLLTNNVYAGRCPDSFCVGEL